jgi:hypothetical protein
VSGPLRRRALGRFLTRCVLVSAAAKEKEFLFPPPADEEAEEALAADLADRVRRVQGPVCLDPVLAQYEQWAADFQRRARSPLQAALAGRLQLCCLKVAILEQVADAPDPVLTPAALDRAIAAIEQVSDRLAALDPSDQEDPDARDRARVARILQEEREIRWSDLQQRTHLTRRRLLNATQALMDADMMGVRKEARLGGGRPLFVAFWRGSQEQAG